MALLTGGTAATTTLKALLVGGAMGAGTTGAHDVAAWNALVKAQSAFARVEPTAFALTGQLFLPEKRGVIQCLPGDYIMVDPTSGWPIVVSAQAITGGGFVHS